ncbi:hypothetical protein Nmel_008313, partial [Mimus melanotis]
WGPHPPFGLILTDNVLFETQDWQLVQVGPQFPGLFAGLDCTYVILGDAKHTPQEIEIVPMSQPVCPDGFSLLARCVQPLYFLPKGQPVAQAIPVPNAIVTKPADISVYWAEVICENKPIISCGLRRGEEYLGVDGLFDTGADVTIIPEHKWPSHWDLQPVAGKVRGIGGAKLAHQSKSIIKVEGPDGHVANVRPFVMEYDAPLWGRDVMSQWGVQIVIPNSPQDF